MMQTQSSRVYADANENRGVAPTEVRIVFETAFDAVLVVDGGGRVIAANATAGALFRTTARELIGLQWSELRRGPGPELPSPGLSEWTALRADGTPALVECNVASVSSPTARFVCLVRPVGKRLRVEQQILDEREQLQRQIGQDLHDGLGQLLTGTAFIAKSLQQVIPAEQRAQGERLVALIDQAVARVRSFARGSPPIPVDSQSLAEVLGKVVAESASLFDVDCVLEPVEDFDNTRPATVLQLALITREAITNAVRHGHARHIAVRLRRQQLRSLLTIENEGIAIGRDVLAGLGIRSMRQRARTIGGTLEIVRTAVGTCVRCWWSE
jgi:signal transduction histidine kinase